MREFHFISRINTKSELRSNVGDGYAVNYFVVIIY